MLKRLLFVPLLLLGMVAGAQSFDTIYLKDGTVLSGFVSEQGRGGKVKITFTSITYSLPSDKIAFDIEKKGVIVAGKKYKNAEINVLESGDYITLHITPDTPDTFETGSDQILKMEKADVSHVIDVIMTKDESTVYKGHILETGNGKYVKIESEGAIYLIGNNNIKEQRRETDVETSNLLQQSPLLDIYTLKDGSVVKGVLVCQNFLTGGIEFISEDGFKNRWTISEIDKVCREVNPKYQGPESDKILVNALPFTPIYLRIKENYIYMQDVSSFIGNARRGKVVFELKSIDKKDNYIIFSFNPMDRDRDGKYIKMGKVSDIEESEIQYSISRRTNGMIKIQCDDLKDGYYCLYNTNTYQALPVWIY